MPKKKAEIDFSKIKPRRIIYFNDGFYAYDFPHNIDAAWLKGVPNERFIFRSKECITLYPAGSTTILGNMERKREIEDWKARIGLYESSIISETALIKGSTIHDTTDKAEKVGAAIIYNDRKAPEFSELEIKELRKDLKKRRIPLYIITEQEIWVQICRYAKILKDLKPQVFGTEEKIFNIKEFYAGTLDRKWYFPKDIVGYQTTKTIKLNIKAGKWIVDIKTGKNFDTKSYWRQLASYYFALPDNADYQGAIILHLNYDKKAGVNGGRVHIMYRKELEKHFRHFLYLKELFYEDADYTPKHFELPSIVYFNKVKPLYLKPKKKITKKIKTKKNVRRKPKTRTARRKNLRKRKS
ncbi:MAG: hypothetical protein WC358_11845 [Ignavibacteria bacterium]|jgi:hypothetical protein